MAIAELDLAGIRRRHGRGDAPWRPWRLLGRRGGGGGPAGSRLLWVLAFARWTGAITPFSRHLPEEFVARVLGVMGLVSAGFLAFLLLTSNPFTRLLPAPPAGRELNPLLQDYGMWGHPPRLYMGYLGFVVGFAFAIAGLLSGRRPR